MEGLLFIKMHGLGNDFVIIDGRRISYDQPLESLIDGEASARIADRHRGIGCDQLILLAAPKNSDAQTFMHIRNADGSESSACGNATRCVAALLMDENGGDEAIIETNAGILIAEGANNGVRVDMGEPGLDWGDIPLAQDEDTLHLPLQASSVSDGAACSMGNPHATFFVDDIDALDLEKIGPVLEHDPIFPERANIGCAEIKGKNELRLRVWERGAGLTQACGTGACGTVVNGIRRGLLGRNVTCHLDGGTLEIEWREADNHVLMSGPVSVAFTGMVAPSLITGKGL